MIDPENKIGYVRLTQFARNSYRDLTRVMQDLTKQGIKGFVLDLRFNPGGLLDSAVKITDLFIDDGLIVSDPAARRPARTSSHGQHDGQPAGLPDGLPGQRLQRQRQRDRRRRACRTTTGPSSSASAATARAACRTSRRSSGGEIKLTTASFWRPSGKNLNKSLRHASNRTS